MKLLKRVEGHLFPSAFIFSSSNEVIKTLMKSGYLRFLLDLEYTYILNTPNSS